VVGFVVSSVDPSSCVLRRLVNWCGESRGRLGCAGGSWMDLAKGHDSVVPRNFVREGGSTNSGEDRGQREQGSGGGSPLVRGSAQFANE
jgi:hypothetical protein